MLTTVPGTRPARYDLSMEFEAEDYFRALIVAAEYFGTYIVIGWTIRRVAEHVMGVRAKDLEEFTRRGPD